MRSSASKNVQAAQPDLFEAVGVGARQAESNPSLVGGGYQDVCMAEKLQKKSAPAAKIAPPRDPRLDDLRACGLQLGWIRVAEEIGVDATLTAWRILDADPASSIDGTTLRVPLRAWRTYLRYQRNRYITTLRDAGLSPHQVHRRLIQQLGERLSISHIRRIFAQR